MEGVAFTTAWINLCRDAGLQTAAAATVGEDLQARHREPDRRYSESSTSKRCCSISKLTELPRWLLDSVHSSAMQSTTLLAATMKKRAQRWRR